jgi:hypothetical protein
VGKEKAKSWLAAQKATKITIDNCSAKEPE